ncbi:hypothetical protein HB816_04920 [Listeria booriae]|uniref:hypothetical protein n=1 Tax=Listeria booriae TaxID=1552123 RepID=UPI0016280366|nr:hypothetical protein [Listeria booriae]MBC1229795.1 hypothetical protein [Listeria booriae]MBC1233144.1 hypothetical protein [Listeria booriae]
MEVGSLINWGEMPPGLIGVFGTVVGGVLTYVMGFLERKYADNKKDNARLNEIKNLKKEYIFQFNVIENTFILAEKHNMLTEEAFQTNQFDEEFFRKTEPCIKELESVFTELKSTRNNIINLKKYKSLNDDFTSLREYLNKWKLIISQKEDYKTYEAFKDLFKMLEGENNKLKLVKI